MTREQFDDGVRAIVHRSGGALAPQLPALFDHFGVPGQGISGVTPQNYAACLAHLETLRP